jgi:hypothetical protein
MLLEYTHMGCGTATQILEAYFSWYEQIILTNNWITECWRYLSLCKSTVMMSGLWTPTKRREGDTILIDEFTRQCLTDKQMRDVNRCRIHLHAFYTSDITDLVVNAIEDWAKQGKRQENRRSKWNWPVQQRPTAAA